MTQSKKEQKLRRRFLGVVITSKYDKEGNLIPEKDRKFENAHLKAYLKGQSEFIHGYTYDPVRKIKTPNIYEVKQQYYYE